MNEKIIIDGILLDTIIHMAFAGLAVRLPEEDFSQIEETIKKEIRNLGDVIDGGGSG